MKKSDFDTQSKKPWRRKGFDGGEPLGKFNIKEEAYLNISASGGGESHQGVTGLKKTRNRSRRNRVRICSPRRRA